MDTPPLLPEARHARLSGVRLEYLVHGHGPRRLVLVHGFEASARIWTAVQRALPADRYTTLAIHNRGAGGSDAPEADEDYGVEPFAADVAELVQALGWTRFTLVGHSMGGATVARCALDHPELLEGLVLLNPANPDGRPGSEQQMELRIAAFLGARRARLAAQAPCTPAPGDWRALLDQDMARAPEARLRGSLRSMHRLRIGAQLATLSMPTLLACGDRDDLIPLADLLDTWRKLPVGAGLQVWHGVGHSPNLECPEALAALLQRFVDALPGAAAAG